MPAIGKVLIANRGEIAVRLIRACRDAGYTSVAVYAEPDRAAPHVGMADQAVALGGTTSGDSYLVIEKVIAAAGAAGADAVHPGYGFLSENADFAQAVLDAGLTWIGPPPQAIRELGDKVIARRIAQRAGAPLVPGTDGPVRDSDDVVAFAAEYGLPVAIKATYGGGGRGLKVARTLAEIPELYASAVREAITAFGRGECFAERYLDRSRHVEAQVLADQHGNIVVAGTRDCSLQRRNQKLIEEAPAPFLTGQQRSRIHESAKAICREAGYHGAGTVEYLVGPAGEISFLEVNARLQVEHPVTEETSGIDLVQEQFRIAEGLPLRFSQDPIPRGHAFEFRINGEDPGHGFLPKPGTITSYREPAGPGVRVDSGVEAGSVIGAGFDSLLAKLIVTGETRAHALRRARRALAEYNVGGMATALPFHRAVVRDQAFTAEPFAVHTRWIETEFANDIPPYRPDGQAGQDEVTVVVGGRAMALRLPGLGDLGELGERIRSQQAGQGQRPAVGPPADAVRSPMQGTVVKVHVAAGVAVKVGDVVAVVEAMKMENAVTAHKAGIVANVQVAAGQQTAQDAVLCEIKDVAPPAAT